MENNQKNTPGVAVTIALGVLSIVLFLVPASHIMRDQKRASDYDIIVESIYNTFSSTEINNIHNSLYMNIGTAYYLTEDIDLIPQSIVNIGMLEYAVDKNWLTVDCLTDMKEYLPFYRLGLISVYHNGYFVPEIIEKKKETSGDDVETILFVVRLKFYESGNEKRAKTSIDTCCTLKKVLDNGQWKIDSIVMEDILLKWQECK